MNLALEKALRELAVQLEQHESDIIRKALWEFIKAHRQIPNSLANET
jgi:predicted transcriptional regulator